MSNRRSSYRRHIIGILSAHSGVTLNASSIPMLADSLADAIMDCDDAMHEIILKKMADEIDAQLEVHGID